MNAFSRDHTTAVPLRLRAPCTCTARQRRCAACVAWERVPHQDPCDAAPALVTTDPARSALLAARHAELAAANAQLATARAHGWLCGRLLNRVRYLRSVIADLVKERTDG